MHWDQRSGSRKQLPSKGNILHSMCIFREESAEALKLVSFCAGRGSSVCVVGVLGYHIVLLLANQMGGMQTFFLFNENKASVFQDRFTCFKTVFVCLLFI